MDKNIIREFSLYVLLSLAALGIFAFTQIFLVLLVLPLLLGVYTYKRNVAHAMVLFVAMLIIALVLNYSMFVFVMFAAVSIPMIMYMKKAKDMEAIFVGLAFSVLAFVLTVVFAKVAFNVDFILDIKAELRNFQIPPELMESYKQAAGGIALKQAKELIIELLPSILLVCLFFYSALIYFCLRLCLRIVDKTYQAQAISQLHLPGRPLLGTTIMIVLAMLLSYFTKQNVFVTNTLYLVLMIFSFDGIAMVFYIFEKLKLPAFVRFLLALVAIMLLHMIGLAILGWIDVAFRLRRKAGQNG